MNLDYLRYFVKLAHVQHYTRAAAELCITQPSLSHAMAQLEKELGVALFEKNGRKTTLTRYGEEFLTCAEHTLATLDDGVAALARMARGEGLVRLGFLRPLGVEMVPKLAAQFLQTPAGKNVHFSFHTGATRELLEGLTAQHYDLVFCSEPPARLGLHAAQVLIAPLAHPLVARAHVTLEEAARYPQIFFTPNAGLRDVVDHLYAEASVTPQIAYETEEDQVIAGLVAQGFGVAIVPEMDLLAQLPLAVVQLDASAPDRNIYLVNDDNIYMPPAVAHFRDFVLAACGAGDGTVV